MVRKAHRNPARKAHRDHPNDRKQKTIKKSCIIEGRKHVNRHLKNSS